MGQVFFRAIACGVAGLLAWLITEPFADRYIPIDPNVVREGSGQIWLIFLIGGLVGLAAGALHGLARGSRRHVIESGLLGLVFGAIGAVFGSNFGFMIAAVVMNVPPGGIHHIEPMPARMVARALALFPMGLFMGLTIGLTLKSKRGVLAGLLGGLVGGLFVGFGFDILGQMISPMFEGTGGAPPEGYQPETGGPSRALLAVGLGAAVGLFVAVFDRVTRQAWVRLVLGRNEGKEWPIDSDKTMIGRDERAHVPLFGDMNVAPLHAVIFRQGSQYVLQDQNTTIGIGWNGQRVQTANLSPGDTFQIGGHNLQFLMKDSAARAMHEGRAHGIPVAAPTGAPIQPIQLGQPNSQPYQQPGQQAVVSPSQPTQAFPAGTGGTYALVATGGPLTGQRFEVVQPIEAGREVVGITLGFDSQASRRHASFTPTVAGVQMQDLGSTNGTFVNGQRTMSALLNRGDVVQLGNSTFRVE